MAEEAAAIQKGVLLKVFMSETELYNGKPLYEYIVRAARELQLFRTTVTCGMMRLSPASAADGGSISHLAEDLPIVIDIVDTREKVEPLLAVLQKVLTQGTIVLVPAEIIGTAAVVGDAAE